MAESDYQSSTESSVGDEGEEEILDEAQEFQVPDFHEPAHLNLGMAY